MDLYRRESTSSVDDPVPVSSDIKTCLMPFMNHYCLVCFVVFFFRSYCC